jgi:hypothetical protein
MTYDEIMSALLQAYEAHPEMDVEQIIAQVAQKLGASEKSLGNIKESIALLDKMQEMKMSLDAAHDKRDSTKKWILSETARMTESRTDDEKAQFVTTMNKTVDRWVEESLKGVELKQKED